MMTQKQMRELSTDIKSGRVVLVYTETNKPLNEECHESLAETLTRDAGILDRLDEKMREDSIYYGKLDYEHVTERIDLLTYVKTGVKNDPEI